MIYLNFHQPPGRVLGSDLQQGAAEGEGERRLEEEEEVAGVGEAAAPLLTEVELPPGGQDGLKGAESLGLNRLDLQLSGETE